MNGGTMVAIALSLISAVAYASAAVAQERLAARTETGTGLFALLGRGAWWWSVGLNAAGALLHVAALTYGSLTVVQPLGALTLVAAVPLGAHRAGRQVTRGEWRGTVLTLVGLAAILLAAAGTAPSETLSLPEALGVGGAAMALVALLTRARGRPGLRHAAASGITSGVASALTQTVTVAATTKGREALPMWQVALVALLVAAFASGGLLLSQKAYQGGLGAPLALLTLANPMAAAAIGLTLLGERLQGGTLGIAAAVAGAVAAARGVVLLTRSAGPAVASSSATDVPVASLPSQSPGRDTQSPGRDSKAGMPVPEPRAAREAVPGVVPSEPLAPRASGGPADSAVTGRGSRERRRERRRGRPRVSARPSRRRGKADHMARQSAVVSPPDLPGAGVPAPVPLFALQNPGLSYTGPVFGRIIQNLPEVESGGPQ